MRQDSLKISLKWKPAFRAFLRKSLIVSEWIASFSQIDFEMNFDMPALSNIAICQYFHLDVWPFIWGLYYSHGRVTQADS